MYRRLTQFLTHFYMEKKEIGLPVSEIFVLSESLGSILLISNY
jgi:hypothetical protein